MNYYDALRKINYLCMQKHNELITNGFGHILVYQEKIDEATDFMIDKRKKNNKTTKHYPFLEKEAKATNKSIEEVAEIIIQKRKEWIKKASDIEYLRLKAKEKLSKEHKNDAVIEELNKELNSL